MLAVRRLPANLSSERPTERAPISSRFPQYGHSSQTSGGILPGLSLREQLGIPSPKSLSKKSRKEVEDSDEVGDSLDSTEAITDSIASLVLTPSLDDSLQWQDAEAIAAALKSLDYASRMLPKKSKSENQSVDEEEDFHSETPNPYLTQEEGAYSETQSYHTAFPWQQPFSQGYFDGASKDNQTFYPTQKTETTPTQSIASNRKSKPVESPGSKLTFKAFYREFWTLARTDPPSAFNFAVTKLESLPEKLHWRVCMEIADLAKRQNRINKARKWYKLANKLEPFAAQTWLEHAKMEEECGELIRCQKIVRLGLIFCEHNESLLIKAIKHQERVGNIPAARAVLSKLKHVSVEKVWRTILEGALLEARAGNVDVARRIFKYLMKYVPWYGPVFFEACRFEERQEEYDRAVAVAERGLAAVPKYGPLWFIAFRLYQKLHSKEPSHARQVIRRAMESISHDVVWKLYFEAAQMEENISQFEESRRAYAESVKHCPKNLCWKAWLSGSRMELRTERIEVARLLLNRSLNGVPKKMRSVVLIECARLEEYAGNTAKARAILRKAQEETNEWKVYLESVLLEARANDMEAAIKEAENALKGHAGTGRLWAVLIQLKQIQGQQEQMRVFRKAIKEVPKSGEVWCEGARMRLDPTGSYFNLKAAHKFLNFAIEFTPQYGDSFIEYLRLKMLLQGEAAQDAIARVKQLCINADPNYGSLWFYCKRHPLDTASEVMARAAKLISKDLLEHRSLYQQAILNNWCLTPSSVSNPLNPLSDPFVLTKKIDSSKEALSIAKKDVPISKKTSLPKKQSISTEGPKTARSWASVACKSTSQTREKSIPSAKSTVSTMKSVPSSGKTLTELFKAAAGSSIVSATTLPQTKTKLNKRVKDYRLRSINSLFRLYPRIDRLATEERHLVLFGADPITA